jgi:DNA replication protein DnaC
MRAEVAFRRQKLILDEATTEHIKQAAHWLINPYGKSGLMLMGLCGNGKTTLMRAIARLIEYVTEKANGYSRRKIVRLVSAKQVARACVGDVSAKAEFGDLFNEPMLAIDDLGTEPAEVVSFGMVYTPMIDLIGERYDRQRFTIITTNLTGDALEKAYGARVLDRMREIMEIIPFQNSSYRK